MGAFGKVFTQSLEKLSEVADFASASDYEKAVRQLACILRAAEYYFFQKENPENLVWLGCPAIPSQLMNQLQLALRARGQLLLPEQEQDTQKIASITELSKKVRNVLFSFMNGDEVQADMYQGFRKSLGRIKSYVLMMRMDWAKLVTAADAVQLEQMIQQLGEAEKPQPTSRATICTLPAAANNRTNH